ncbi:zinc finger protein SNAI3-like isoform 2-T2 [Pelodytes ibericus]
MPRSFLVKKPCSHRIPNYGQLLTSHTGMVVSLLQNEGSGLPKHEVPKHEFPEQQNTLEVLQSLMTTEQQEPSDKTFLESRVVDTALSDYPNGLPLKDSINNLNMPLWKRISNGDVSLPRIKTTMHCPPQSDSSYALDPVDCSDFEKAYGLLSDQRSHHCHGSAHKFFSCQQCTKTYTSLGALKMHIRTHTLPCACMICGKAFSRPWLLQGHIRTHTGEKPFSCFNCGRGFADRSNLRAHQQTHSEIKRYMCPGCGKSFSRISLLAKHRDGCCCPLS